MRTASAERVNVRAGPEYVKQHVTAGGAGRSDESPFAFPLFPSCCYLSGPGAARWQEPEISQGDAREADGDVRCHKTRQLTQFSRNDNHGRRLGQEILLFSALPYTIFLFVRFPVLILSGIIIVLKEQRMRRAWTRR